MADFKSGLIEKFITIIQMLSSETKVFIVTRLVFLCPTCTMPNAEKPKLAAEKKFTYEATK